MQDLQVGHQLEVEGQLDKAITTYRKAVQSHPNSAEAHHTLGKALTKKGYWKEAISCYQEAVKLDLSLLTACNELGNYLKNLGHTDKAIDLYKKVGETLNRIDKLDEAIAVYQEAIKLKLDPKWFYLYIGDIYNRKDDQQASIDAYLQAIEIAPEFWQPHDRLLIKVQRLKLKPKLLKQLIPAYRKVIQKKPDYLLAYSNLGDILTKLNRLDEAVDCYQAASYRQNSQLKPEFVETAWDSEKKGEVPKFIIIGSMRCGTTSLYEYLTYHPQFVPAIKKEVKFFNFNYESGKEWYLAHFPSIREGSGYITGEGSPDHLYFPKVAKRIIELFPDMKLIVMLRNPVERSVSQYYHWIKVGAEHRSLEDSIASDLELVQEMVSPSFDGKIKRKGKAGCLLESVYVHFLEKWMSVIPKEQFLILKSEDFYQDTPKVLSQVFEFVGLPQYELQEYKTYNAGSYSKIDESTRQRLVECFRPHNQRLEEFLGMKFGWDNE